MSWTNDVVLEFLDLYRQEQILWDPKHPHHRNRNEINDAWFRIQSSLSITCAISDLKRKKESLMTSFRMHLHRKRKSRGEYRTSWFAFPLMESFLGGKYECDSTNQTENELLESESSYTQNTNTDPISTRHITVSERNTTAVRRRHSPSEAKTSKSKLDYVYAKKEVEDSTYFPSTGDKKELDEYDLYGQLLAKKLRKLDEHQRDVAMHEIDNIMFRVKVQNNSSQNRTFTASPSPVPQRIKSPVFIVTQPSQIEYED